MEIAQGQIWYDPVDDVYVEVASLYVSITRVESGSSSVAFPTDDVVVRAGEFDGYGPMPWGVENYTIEEFEERFLPSEYDRDEALDEIARQNLGY